MKSKKNKNHYRTVLTGKAKISITSKGTVQYSTGTIKITIKNYHKHISLKKVKILCKIDVNVIIKRFLWIFFNLSILLMFLSLICLCPEDGFVDTIMVPWPVE